MKKGLVVVFLLIAMSAYGQRGAGTLDGAINNSAQRIQDGLRDRSTIIVYQFQSPNARLSNYILHELFDLLVNSNKFTVLDRGSREVIDAEINFQFQESAGMISDDSLASLTRRIGAQAIITGSLDDAGDEYRFRIRVIGTETMAAIVSYTTTVSKNDRRIVAFQPKAPTSTGDKIGTGALNIVLGLGSYLEGDIMGGFTITAGYAVALGLIVVEALVLDWDSPAVGIPGTAGFITAGLTFAYGFARPFIHNRSPKLSSIMDSTQIKIVELPNTESGVNALQLSWSLKY
jgi:hypothetical protein